jgi:exopolysaccharide production protein ExoZ
MFGLFIPVGLALLSLTPTELGDLGSSIHADWALRRAIEWGVPAAMVLWGGVSLEAWFQGRAFNLPVRIGDASYSIYLFHPLVSYGFDLFWPLRVVLGLGVGLAVYLLVEKRVMALRAKPRCERRIAHLQEA